MIVSFSVSPEVFDAFDPDDPVAVNAHLRLQEAWRVVGTLHLPTEPEARQAWLRSLERLPMPLRKRWQLGLRHNRWALADEADLLCLTPEQAAAHGVRPPRASARLTSTVEVCRFDCADRAPVLHRARTEAHLGIAPGVAVEEAWARKFAGLLANARHVVLVDRYALQGHVEAGRVTERGSRPAPSGLERLLRGVDALPGRTAVAVYSRPWSGHERALNLLAGSLTGGGVRELRLRVVSDEVFSRHAHDRHLRVDRTVVQLGKGIEVLAGQLVDGASDFDAKPASAFSRVREAQLRQACRELRWARDGATGGLARVR